MTNKTQTGNPSALVFQRTFTSAEILALKDTPQEIIPAPGAGKLIVVDYSFYKGAGAYTQVAGAGLWYGATGIPADISAAFPANPFQAGVIAGTGGVAQNPFLATDYTAALNQAVMFAALTTNPTVGATPVTLTVHYHVVTP